MNSIRRNTISLLRAHAESPKEPSVYLIHEKNTGTTHFRVEAGPDGELPVDHAAGLLAMHCMVHGQCPSDYLIMVPAATENLRDLSEKAQKLLEEGRSSSDFDKRFAIYQQANKLLVDDAPYVYFYTPLSLRAWKPYVQGFVNRPDQLNALWTTWLDK